MIPWLSDSEKKRRFLSVCAGLHADLGIYRPHMANGSFQATPLKLLAE